GIGSALFYNGVLVPNTEFGHLKFHKSIAEKYTSNATRKEKDLSWDEFGGRLNEFLKHLEFIFSPNLFILGGGLSKKFDLYKEFFALETTIVPAKFQNEAGVIGAALYAHRMNF
ncbi:MAG TPA: ROK family protein, partial [Saprospiraceae bacterium]|nr:ROK family protein [Saprospiraceae bacterium]